jgi:hypothetical protein
MSPNPYSLAIDSDGGVELSHIDYDKETGPFWYVVIDDTPMSPDRPLPLEHAIAAFRREVADVAEDGSTVELRQCDDEDLKWAGVEVGGGAEEDDEDAGGEGPC